MRGDYDMNKIKRGAGLSLLLAFALLGSIASHAQTTVTNRESNFEIIAVDGNNLVVRDQAGTRELTVPPDFKFTVDGKSMGIGDLHAGMKGTAVVTTTTIQRPVYVTTIKMGTVTYQTARSVQIKEDNGQVHKFTQEEADARGVRLYMGDKPIRISQLNPGDKVTATIVSSGKPEILTVKAVDAQLAAAAGEPAAAEPEAEQAVVETPAAAPAAEPAPEPQAAAPEATPDTAKAESTSPFDVMPNAYFKHPLFMLLVLIILVALIWVLMRRRVKK
jgi:hypothetical protein